MKVALIGSAPSSVALGPYHDQRFQQFIQGKPAPAYPPAHHIDEEWDIWVCSPGAYGVVPRATRWFEVHRWEPGQAWFSPEYCQFLRAFKGPVYTGQPVPEIKNHLVYPYRRVEAAFSSYFLTSSLALMAAIAILEVEDLRALRRLHQANPAWLPSGGRMHPAWQRLAETMPDEQIEQEVRLPLDTPLDQPPVDTIGFWGVDMSANEEYSRQKPGCWFFILEALRRGIGVYVPPESDLLNPEPPYGLSEWGQDYIKCTQAMREFNDRIGRATQQRDSAISEIVATTGAKDALNHHIKTFLNKDRIPAGIVMRIVPGEGLGANTSHINGIPVEDLERIALAERAKMAAAPPPPPPAAPAQTPPATEPLATSASRSRSRRRR